MNIHKKTGFIHHTHERKLGERNYQTLGLVLANENIDHDMVEINISFSDVPKEKRSQIESAAKGFLDLAKKIMAGG